LSLSIQRAQRKDLDAIIALNDASMPEHYKLQFWNFHLDYFWDVFLAAKIDDKVVGYVMCHAETIHHVRAGIIISLAVAPEHKREGIGKELMQNVQRIFRMKGIPLVALQVRKSNVDAIRFYEGLGYQTEMMLPGYYTEPTEDGWLMSRVL